MMSAADLEKQQEEAMEAMKVEQGKLQKTWESVYSRRRDCHSAELHRLSPCSRCFNMDGGGMSAK